MTLCCYTYSELRIKKVALKVKENFVRKYY